MFPAIPCISPRVGNHRTVNSELTSVTQHSPNAFLRVASLPLCRHYQLTSTSGIQTTLTASVPSEVIYGFVGVPLPSESATPVDLH